MEATYIVFHIRQLARAQRADFWNWVVPFCEEAAQILGRKPERIEKFDFSAQTFHDLFPFDRFANASVPIESSLPWMTTHRSEPSHGASGVLDTL